MPARETFDGAMIILGGALLLAPGLHHRRGRLRAPDPADPGGVPGGRRPAARRRVAFGWAIPASPPGRRGARPADRARPAPGRAATTTRARRTRSTTRRRDRAGRPRWLSGRRSSSRRPTGETLRFEWDARRARGARPGRPRGRAGLAARRRARLGRGRGACGCSRRASATAACWRSPRCARPAPRATATSWSPARSATPGAFEQLDEALISTEYGPDGAAAPGRPRALSRRRAGSRSGSPATSTRAPQRRRRRRSSALERCARAPRRRAARRPRPARAPREAARRSRR